VSVWDRYPPRGDLGRLELGERKIPELGERRRVGQVLLLAELLERAFERLGGRLLGREAAALHSR
jgi:hypothetical protein